jgi:GNAT superfamily N-acetyltransferase
MQIIKAYESDLGAILQLLAEARAWQRSEGVDIWSEFDREQIAADVRAGRVFVARSDASILGTVTLLETDSRVWDADEGAALYVHKLASSRSSAGRGVGARLLQWAQEFARRLGKRRLRLDTWDGNRKMRAYYERQGFRHVRDAYFAPDSPLPADYRGTHKSLYQLDL